MESRWKNGKIYLCDVCIQENKDAKAIKCHNCGELAWSKGGAYTHDGKKHCKQCIDEIKKDNERKRKDKEKKKEQINNIKKNIWKFGKALGLVLGIIVSSIIIINYLPELLKP